MNPFYYVNRRGSAAIQSTAVAVNTDNVVFSFPNHAFVNAFYRGTVFVNLSQSIPTGTTDTLPIVFETNGATQAVTIYNGAAFTVSDFRGTGIYEMWFDKTTNTLQVLTY